MLEIETLGSAGLRYRSRLRNARDGEWVECAAIPVHWAKDAAGAGDWCTAGLVDRLCRNGRAGLLQASRAELSSAVKYGQALASWACGFEGARGGMYEVTRAELEEEISGVLTGRERRTVEGERERRGREEVVGAFCPSCERHTVMASGE